MADKKQMVEQSEDIGTLIGLVASQEYSDASSLVNDLLNARVAATLDEYKQHVAHNLFAPSLTEEKEEDKDEDDDKDEKKDDKKDDDKDDEDSDEDEDDEDKDDKKDK